MTTTALPEIEFGQPIDRPKVVRAPKVPNPFTKPVQDFIDAGDAAKDKAVPFTVAQGKATKQKVKGVETGKMEYKDVLRVLSKLRAAAPDGYGVRTAVDYDTPRKGTATVKFWVKAKPAPEAAAPDATPDAAPDAPETASK